MGVFQQVVKTIQLNAKNVIGWRTRRKIVVFSVDDYGNVRVDSKEAREALKNAGVRIRSRFDLYDSLEDEEDLLALYDVLSSVKDAHGNPAVFTAFALPANIDFERMTETNFSAFYYEPLYETFNKLPGYERVYDLWREGIRRKMLIPQFHGREHVNVKALMEGLRRKDRDILLNFENRSYTSISTKFFPTISYPAAFDFYKYEENEALKEIIRDGLDVFERVFGFRASHFNSPAGQEHQCLEGALHAGGIEYIDAVRFKKEHQGEGRYKSIFHYTGKKNGLGQVYLVRNCVFEPTEDRGLDWVDFCLKQIETAFAWNQPANISSHRVNFCGHIDPANRKVGLDALRQLLKKVTERWPDVEFMAANELGQLIKYGNRQE